VFGIMYLLDIFFTPRLKDLGSLELYNFVSWKVYADLGYSIPSYRYLSDLLL
jgi:TnpA family transposase